jgi:hypothetical protein
VPTATDFSAVPHSTGHSLRVGEEAERHPAEQASSVVGPGLSQHDHQETGDVVGAVTVRTPRLGELGVFEQSDAVAHRDQVVE